METTFQPIEEGFKKTFINMSKISCSQKTVFKICITGLYNFCNTGRVRVTARCYITVFIFIQVDENIK